MVSSRADLLAAITALLPHKIAVLLLLSSMLLEISTYSRLLHILLFSSALPTGKIFTKSGLRVRALINLWVSDECFRAMEKRLGSI